MNAPALSTRRFNERFDAAVRAQALDIESVLRLIALEAELDERATRTEPAPVRAPREVAA